MATKPPAANAAPIIIVRRKKKGGHGGHHGGAWKVAYADFVTAMMAFFMLLWLIANPDKERLKGLAEYFTPSPPTYTHSGPPSPSTAKGSGEGGFQRRAQSEAEAGKGVPSTETATEGASRGGSAAVPDPSLKVLAEELKVALESAGDEAVESFLLEPGRDGLRISLTDTSRTTMFRPGTAEPTPLAKLMLDRVAKKLGPTGPRIAIEGHTDQAGGEGNWRLSAERANATRRLLLTSGIPPARIGELVALADTKPVYPDEPNRPENRRITLVLIGESAALPADSSFRF